MSLTSPEILDQNRWTNLWLKRMAIIGACLFLLINAITAVSVVRIAQGAKNQGASNARFLAILLEVTGCTTEDKPGECAGRLAQRMKERDLVEGTRRIAEVDCITRRALAGLRAPDPSKPCIEQTPQRIYPGN